MDSNNIPPLKDSILLRINRKYKKDEEVNLLLQEISRLKFKVGEQSSEIAELNYRLKSKKDLSPEQKEFMRVNSQLESISRLKKEVNKWRMEFQTLIYKLSDK